MSKMSPVKRAAWKAPLDACSTKWPKTLFNSSLRPCPSRDAPR